MREDKKLLSPKTGILVQAIRRPPQTWTTTLWLLWAGLRYRSFFFLNSLPPSAYSQDTLNGVLCLLLKAVAVAG